MIRFNGFCLLSAILLVLLPSLSAAAPPTQAVPPISTLVAIRAAYHPEATPHYDRVVFEFSGAVPLIEVRSVPQLIGDASGLPIPITGNAIVEVTTRPAQAHDTQGRPTAPTRRAFNLRSVTEVVSAGDFEGVVSYGIGLAHATELRVITLAQPSRVVIDFVNP